MKTTILSILAIFTLSTGTCVAKGGGGDDTKIVVGVSVGAGMPMGAFGTKDKNSSATDTTHTNGWAKTGFHFDVNFGYKFSDNIGGMVMIGGNMNGFDATTYDTKYNNKAGTTTATSYYTGSYLIGPFLNFPVGDKFAITARVLGGLMTSKSATLSQDIPVLGTATQTMGSVSTFGYDAGVGAKIGLTDMLGLGLNADYLGGTPTFTTYTTTFGGKTSTSTGHKIAMGTGIINLSVGLVLSF